jgi:PAS domain S-box-containing protein
MSSRILIVEDNQVLTTMLRGQLEKLGYEVAGSAARGEDAIRLASELKPDLVLMDIQLEGKMDGPEAAEAIRRELSVPIVYVTAGSKLEFLDRVKISEPYGYILKPVNARELHIVIEIALYRRRMLRRLEEREQWFAAALGSMEDGVTATDSEARIAFMNRAAEAVIGCNSEQAAGRFLDEILQIRDDAGDTVECPLRRAIRERKRIAGRGNARSAAKESVPIRLNYSAVPISCASGACLGAVMVVREVVEDG